jgi:CRISPR system Cascade subunit CasD
MSPYLIFTIAAPLASFGEVAGSERRGGRDWPGKSAVLGLTGAALGLHRDDDEAQRALVRDYGFAVQPEQLGRPLLDYHTVQSLPSRKGRHPSTRAAALAFVQDLETVITRREYRMDVIHTIALWERAGARWPLHQIEGALRKPHFVLFAGRKSCPLSLPLDPRVVEAADVMAALATARDMTPPLVLDLRRSLGLIGDPLPVASDIDGCPACSGESERRSRRDVPRDRRRWQFDVREEMILSPGQAAP